MKKYLERAPIHIKETKRSIGLGSKNIFVKRGFNSPTARSPILKGCQKKVHKSKFDEFRCNSTQNFKTSMIIFVKP